MGTAFPVYGLYGGHSWSAASRDPNIDWSVEPVDTLDALYREHDSRHGLGSTPAVYVAAHRLYWLSEGGFYPAHSTPVCTGMLVRGYCSQGLTPNGVKGV